MAFHNDARDDDDAADAQVNAVFRALAEPTRRQIIDILAATPGISIQELTSRFRVSRFAIMKHLNVLEAAGLVRRTREGTTKHLHFDRAPLVAAHRRWFVRHVRSGGGAKE